MGYTRNTIMFLFIPLLLFGFVASDCTPPQDVEFIWRNCNLADRSNVWYGISQFQVDTISDAARSCTSLGGRLVAIHSVEQDRCLNELLVDVSVNSDGASALIGAFYWPYPYLHKWKTGFWAWYTYMLPLNYNNCIDVDLYGDCKAAN